MANPSNPRLGGVRRLAQLRQAVAVVVLVVGVGVLGLYLVNRRREAAQPKLKFPPLGVDVIRTAHGFSFTTHDAAGKPTFHLEAERADEVKQGGRQLLYNVRMDVYDADGIHADEIQGERFGYDPKSGDVVADGAVHIEIKTIPAAGTEKTAPPVRIEAHDLVYNAQSGLGSVTQGLTYSYDAAQGSAQQAHFQSHAGIVDLSGAVKLDWPRAQLAPVLVRAGSARLDRKHDTITLDRQVRLQAGPQSLEAAHVVVNLGPDYGLEHFAADGGVEVRDSAPDRAMTGRAERASGEFIAGGGAGKSPTKPPAGLGRMSGHAPPAMLKTATLDGAAHLEESGPTQSGKLDAGRIELDFVAGNQIHHVRATTDARLALAGTRPANLSAPQLDFNFGPRPAPKAAPLLTEVDSSGRTQVDLTGGLALPGAGGATGTAPTPVHAESDRFRVALDARQQPTRAWADGNVRLRQAQADGEFFSQSAALVIDFTSGVAPASVAAATQTGAVVVRDGARTMHADRLDYFEGGAQGSRLHFTGKVVGDDPGTHFTAREVTVVRTDHDDITGSGGVAVSTIGNGGGNTSGLAQATPFTDSTLPTVITAQAMHLDEPLSASGAAVAAAAGPATFCGNVRLLHGPNLLQADTVALDRAALKLEADGHVQTHFVDPGGNTTGLGATESGTTTHPTPATVTAAHFNYDDAARKASYRDQVVMWLSEATMSAERMDIYLAPAGKGQAGAAEASTFERAVLDGDVKIEQPGRQATSQHLVYDATRRLVTMTGGPPSIFDAENGKATGKVLTFSPSDDAIKIEGDGGTRTVVLMHVHNH